MVQESQEVYDPLSELSLDGDDESDGQLGPHTEYQAKASYASRAADRSAEQRIEDLFADLATRRRVLLGILAFLDAPTHSSELDSKVAELQENDVSVYSGYNYSLLLSEAGAIKKVNVDGSDFDENVEQLPDVIESDGVKFYKPTDGKQIFWVITAEGRAYLAVDDPLDRLTQLIAAEQQYQEIYKKVLEYCDNGDGRSADDLTNYFDGDPLVQESGKHFSYFAKKLEDCDGLYWAKKWRTSDVGKKGLELLFAGTKQQRGGE